MKHRLFGALALLLWATTLLAQQELMLSQTPNVWQFSSLNPAFFPEDQRLMIGLPGIAIDARHSGSLTYNDVIKEEFGQKIVDFDQFISKMDATNEISYRQRLETVSVGFRLPGPGKTALTLSHAMRINSNTTYTKQLAQLLWQGNAQFIGETIEVAPTTRSYDFHEIGLGVSRKFGKMRAGAKIKYLSGISALITDPNANKISVYTNPDIYQLELATDYAFQSAGIISAIDTSGLGFNIARNQLRNGLNGANSGLAFDLGLMFQVSKRLQIHASALDLGGSIRWEAAKYFKTKANYTYEGANIPGADLINGADNLDFSTKLDSLNDIFKFDQTTTNFSSAIPSRYYVGASYEVMKQLTVAGSVFAEGGIAEDKLAFGVSAHFRPIKLVSVGVMYSANRQNAANIGAQVTLSPGPFRIFVASDNLGGAFSPYASSRVNLRAGVAYAY